MAGYDLHTHTVLSDGTTTPEANVAAAIALGLDGLGVTDHDTTEPFERASAAAAGTDLEIVPGTEFSAELDGSSVHVLGYWVDPANEPLQREMDRIRNERAHRAEQIVGKFNRLGIEVTFQRVQQIAAGAPIGRPHIAKAVIETGAASDLQEVFDTWLHDGGPAYVPKHAVDPVTAVQLLTGAGGVAVLAHPGLYQAARSPDGAARHQAARSPDGAARHQAARSPDGAARQGRSDEGVAEDTIEAMHAAGMAGIEADHPDHDGPTRDRYRRIAVGLNLLVTAGSDYHGEAKDLQLGEATTSRDVLERLRERRTG